MSNSERPATAVQSVELGNSTSHGRPRLHSEFDIILNGLKR